MRKWHDAERCKAAERHAKAAAAASIVGISTQLGGGGRGPGGGEGGGVGREGGGGKGWRPAQENEVWVWPSSSEACGPSNGRHKLA